MIKNNETLEKLNEIFKEVNSIAFMRGKLTNPKKRATQENGEVYFEFDLKCLKSNDGESYNQSYSKYHCVVSPSISKNYDDADFIELKNNEVIVLIDITGQIEIKPNVTYNKFNTFWVQDIALLRKIDKKEIKKSVINL